MSGIFDIIRIPFGYVIGWIDSISPNYAITLFIFALLLKIILFPLGLKQHRNTVKQAKLKPKEEAIKKRYAGRTDRPTQQKMQQEIMQMYQDEHFSVGGGCLPLIVQLVVVIALINIVYNPLQYICHIKSANVSNVGIHAVELYNEGNLTIDGLSKSTKKLITDAAAKAKEENKLPEKSPIISEIDLITLLQKNGVEKFYGENMLDSSFTNEDLPNFDTFRIDLSQTPQMSFNWLLIIPLLVFVTTYGSMKLTKKFTYQPTTAQGADANMSLKIMDFVMPLMSTFFCFSFPAIIAVYWMFNNILSPVQQIVLVKVIPYPTYTEEDFKAAEAEMNKGIKVHKSKKSAQKKISAHRIDLIEDEAERTDTKEESKPSAEARSSIVAPAKLKDESDKDSDN